MNKKNSQNQISVSMLVVGDEILNGRTIDLNASYLAKFLFKVGLHLKNVEFIRDNENEYYETLYKMQKTSDIIITSGGIGPTLDDMTKKCLSHFYNKPLRENNHVEKIVRQNYTRFGRTWEPSLNYYHFFPEDFIAFNNPLGLAPGLGYFDQSTNTLILSAPGVPREFEAMVTDEFFPFIEKKFSNNFARTFQTIVRTHSISEEKIFGEIAPNLWETLLKFGKVSSLPHTIGIDIIVSYQSSEAEHIEYQSAINKIFKESPLAKYIWQYGNIDLSQLLLNTLKDKKLTIGFAESCTGGLTSSKITDLSGSSEIFLGSVISYSNDVKINTLGVNQKTLEQFGAVSVECAKEMSIGLQKLLKVDIAVSITGIAGPTGGSIDKPVGTVCFAVTFKNKTISQIQNMPGNRVRRKDRFSEYALWLAYQAITSAEN